MTHQRRERHQPRSLGDVLAQAIDDGDGITASRVVDFLRVRHHCDYQQCFDLALSVRPHLTPAEWDGLLYVADTTEVMT